MLNGLVKKKISIVLLWSWSILLILNYLSFPLDVPWPPSPFNFRHLIGGEDHLRTGFCSKLPATIPTRLRHPKCKPHEILSWNQPSSQPDLPHFIHLFHRMLLISKRITYRPYFLHAFWCKLEGPQAKGNWINKSSRNSVHKGYQIQPLIVKGKVTVQIYMNNWQSKP